MIKIIYEDRDGREATKCVDYVHTTDFQYAVDLFKINRGNLSYWCKILSMELVPDKKTRR